VENQCVFLTEQERKLVEFLKDGPKQYAEIKKHLGGEKTKSKTNYLLKKMDGKQIQQGGATNILFKKQDDSSCAAMELVSVQEHSRARICRYRADIFRSRVVTALTY
jgi:hypothetical protein